MKRSSAQRKNEAKKRNPKTVAQRETDDVKVPRTIVVVQGVQSSLIKRLRQDIRHVFLPNTAQNVKERKFNKMRDFIEVCGPLGVSHMMTFFSTEASLNLKIIKAPQVCSANHGQVKGMIRRDQLSQRRSFDVHQGMKCSPLVVMTNFQKTKHHELLVSLLQNMFPSVDPCSMEFKNKKRVVLFDYDSEMDLIRFRHYQISIPPSGLNKAVKSLLYSSSAPDMGDCASMTEFLTKSGYATESEGEEAAESRIHLSKELATKMTSKEEPTTRRVKLREIGPRMDLTLHKIEQGLMDGLVLYNKLKEKSMEAIAETARKREENAQLKAQRRKEQEMRVEKKRREREEMKIKRRKAIPREIVSDDDDANYYLQEVGEEPDAHFGVRKKTKRLKPSRKESHRSG